MPSCFLAGFLAAFTFKGLFLVFLERFFLNTFPVSFFFKLSNVVDLSDMATCFLDFCIFTGFLAAFMGDFFLVLLAEFFFSGDWATSWTLLEEGLLEFSIFF